MNYKGAYNSGTSYSVGDVVVFTDGIAYELFQNASAGTTPHEKRVWRRVMQPMQDIVKMFHGMFTTLKAEIPDNINDEAITLSTETADYLITVDDSGDTPELTVTAIEEEAAT